MYMMQYLIFAGAGPSDGSGHALTQEDKNNGGLNLLIYTNKFFIVNGQVFL